MSGLLLTDSKIKGIKPKDPAYYVWQAEATKGTGRLGLKVYPSGRKVFVYKYHLNGSRKFLTLGDYPALTLSDAKSKVLEAQGNLSEPEKAIIEYATVKNLFDDYISDQKRRGKRSYEKTQNRLNQVIESKFIPPDMQARDVTPDLIKKILSEFISRGAVAGSNKVRANLHAIFNFGLFADNDPAKLNESVVYGLDRNPVSVVQRQEGADIALDRFLSWDEMKDLLSTFQVSVQDSPSYLITAVCCCSVYSPPDSARGN